MPFEIIFTVLSFFKSVFESLASNGYEHSKRRNDEETNLTSDQRLGMAMVFCFHIYFALLLSAKPALAQTTAAPTQAQTAPAAAASEDQQVK